MNVWFLCALEISLLMPTYCMCQTMLEDKLRETDWELTQDTIEEQVARESYLQWLKDQEKYGKMSKTSVSS